MTSFFAATAARRAHHVLPGLLAASAVSVNRSWLTATSATDCEQQASAKKSVNIKTRMTTIGRFALESETPSNPSIPTFFLSLVGPKAFTKHDFCQLWRTKGIGEHHARFHQVVHNKQFVPSNKPVEHHVKDVAFPILERVDLAYRLAKYLLTPMDVAESLWNLDITSGPLGRSGAISQRRTAELLQPNKPPLVETLLLFRAHHAMADGVSLVAAVTELCDEWEDLQAHIKAELKKKRGKAKSWWQKLRAFFRKLLWFWVGSIKAWIYQIWLLWTTPTHPFDIVKQLSIPSTGRTLSWCEVTSVEEVKAVAAAFGKDVTVNDVWVSCVSFAVSRQLQEHKMRLGLDQQHDTINVVIPVHLQGGMLLPGQSMGNRIGAFAARIPGDDPSLTAGRRLEQTHRSLYTIKQTPAALLSYFTAQCMAGLPALWTSAIFRRANANASVAVTNVRNAPHKLHISGMAVEGVAGFLPLPPGIPIGVAVQSYAGNMQLSLTAEKYAVPDADLFLGWMVEEYQRLLEEAQWKRSMEVTEE